MAGDASYAVQKALYAQLSGAESLSTIDIYDDVPEGAAMPYIRICSYFRPIRWETSTTTGQFVYTQIDVWSDSGNGKLEVLTWMNTLLQALTATKIDPSGDGFALIRAKDESTQITDDSSPEAPLYHGVIDMLYHVQETS